jgi:hypothetical protein
VWAFGRGAGESWTPVSAANKLALATNRISALLPKLKRRTLSRFVSPLAGAVHTRLGAGGKTFGRSNRRQELLAAPFCAFLQSSLKRSALSALFLAVPLLIVACKDRAKEGGRYPSDSESTTELSKRILPPLTQAEAAAAASVTLQQSEDKVEGITWKFPRTHELRHKRSAYLYVGIKDGVPSLRFKLRYYGNELILLRSFRIKLNDHEAFSLAPTSQITRSTEESRYWEIVDEPAHAHAQAINQIVGSTSASIRFQGSNGSRDLELDASDINTDFKDVLLVYRSLGGEWPSD